MWRAAAMATVLVVALLGGAPASSHAQTGAVERVRLAGDDRFATAVAISKAAYPSGTRTALLARGDAFADALAAGALAGARQAPILLSARDRVPAATMAELRRLAVSEVVLLGGPAALGDAVEGQLEAAGLDVGRIAGSSRFDTAALLARALGAQRIGTVDGLRTAFLATGAGFPDALAAGPLAAADSLPILLTPGDRLAPEAAAAIRDLGIEQVIVLGGEVVVSGGVERQTGVRTQRLQGSDRTRTAAAVARFATRHLRFTSAEVVLARGDAFPDALAAAGYAGRRRSPVLLTGAPTALGRGARDHLLASSGAVRRLTALGGTVAVSGGALAEAERAARGITYVFPISPAGAATYGRAHHDYPATDIFAACGTVVVAPTLGRIDEVNRVDRWDPRVNEGSTRGGLSVSLVGDDGVRYYGSHFATIDAGIRPGARVRAGQRLGTVGRTGSARPTPCHLHFGISPPCGQGDWQVRRGVLHPWPYLDAWKAGDHRAPVDEVRAWAAANRPVCPGG